MGFAYNFQPDQGTVDPNSPELFKENLRLIHDHVTNLRLHSQRASAGIKNAYRESHPSQTQDHINNVKQLLDVLEDLLRQTGIGALPLLEPDASGQIQPQTEAQLMDQAEKGVKYHFEQLKRAQESAAVVANLLGIDHRPQNR
ncbi:hypothetical protein AGABI1DRAFT_88230 [Agaricus bisporus var. burnettii JB137-S8]|nr:uncharacterized protein AGABI1DRAFT_88230 [Agaricus bisporus var. burnettii JB137-S8]EKM74737.1 hypothetical protein AGABI1DRAFT_88230 [Agaricus bisporus var. burnettii JB137-S8]